MDGLSLDQAPPLAIPMSFFLAAPLGLVLAGLVLIFQSSGLLVHPPGPQTILFVHAATLGFLTLVMTGALYQMTPVVASSPVPWIRLAYVAFGLFLLGFVGLVAFAFGHLSAGPGFYAIELAAHVFAIPVLIALMKSKAGTITVVGMRWALASFLMVVSLGAHLAIIWTGGPLPTDRALLLEVHILFAICGWVGGLIAAVSWQVLPMFYITREFTRAEGWSVLGPLLLGLAGSLVVLVLVIAGQLEGAGLWAAAFVASPAAIAVWWRHPRLALAALAARRRKRPDPSVDFWRAGLRLALALPLLALGALFTHLLAPDVRFGFAFGWLAIFGWAGLVMHGMLTRIEPFLIWFHRYSPHIGRVPVPPMKRLLPEPLVRFGYRAHLATLAIGLLAFLTHSDWLLRLTGLGLVVTGLTMASYAGLLLRSFPDLSGAAPQSPV
jgi:hypothetical protein